MVPIPSGTIVLRDHRVKRRWTVELKPFLLARYPVTCVQYAAIAAPGPAGQTRPEIPANRSNMPVVDVSWVEAIAFCNTLSSRVGLQPCYAISNDGEAVLVDEGA